MPILSCSDREALETMLLDFAPQMVPKWYFIGAQLWQESLVQELQSSPVLCSQQKVQRIIDEWLERDPKDAPVCAETMSRVLRSPAVALGAAARDFEEVCGDDIDTICDKLYICVLKPILYSPLYVLQVVRMQKEQQVFPSKCDGCVIRYKQFQRSKCMWESHKLKGINNTLRAKSY